MKNLGQLMKQAQEMQAKMAELQAELENDEIEGRAAGDMVRVTLNGKGALRKVKIDPSLVVAEETEVLEDLIVAAHTDAKAKLETHLAEKMSKVTGGLNLPPGLNLPF